MAIRLVASKYEFDLAQKTYTSEGALRLLEDEKKFVKLLRKEGYA